MKFVYNVKTMTNKREEQVKRAAENYSDKYVSQYDQQISYDSFIAGALFSDEHPLKQQMIDKAIKWLKIHMPFGIVEFNLRNTIIEEFKQAMMEE